MMLVRQWMTAKAKCTAPDTPLQKAFEIMKENQVRRLPVINDASEVVGMITVNDCLEASPSPATTLSKYELNYLLDKLTVKEIMTGRVISISPDEPVEEAALLLRREKIDGLPVVENGKLVGIITETDIFDAFVDIMGVNQQGARLLLELDDKRGTLSDITTIINEHIGNITSIAEFHGEEGKVNLLIRFQATEEETRAITTELEKRSYKVASLHYPSHSF